MPIVYHAGVPIMHSSPLFHWNRFCILPLTRSISKKASFEEREIALIREPASHRTVGDIQAKIVLSNIVTCRSGVSFTIFLLFTMDHTFDYGFLWLGGRCQCPEIKRTLRVWLGPGANFMTHEAFFFVTTSNIDEKHTN